MTLIYVLNCNETYSCCFFLSQFLSSLSSTRKGLLLSCPLLPLSPSLMNGGDEVINTFTTGARHYSHRDLPRFKEANVRPDNRGQDEEVPKPHMRSIC